MRRVSALAVVIANAPPLPASRTDGSAVPHSSTLEDEAYEAILLRRSALKVMGWTAQPMVDMVLRKRKFDLDLLQINAARLAELTPLMKESFQQDTRGLGFETRALDSIWTQRDDFKFRADQLTRAANALANAPGRAAPIATLDALRRVLEACAECHEAYLRKDSDDVRR
jgi:cytochrome c556